MDILTGFQTYFIQHEQSNGTNNEIILLLTTLVKQKHTGSVVLSNTSELTVNSKSNTCTHLIDSVSIQHKQVLDIFLN